MLPIDKYRIEKNADQWVVMKNGLIHQVCTTEDDAKRALDHAASDSMRQGRTPKRESHKDLFG
jgi:hypothetical protein